MVDIKTIKKAWTNEGRARDEGRWTDGGEGWTSWNGKSPEVEFCDFAASLVGLINPTKIVETGIGQGYTTRRILWAIGEGQQLRAYESDEEIREIARIATVVFGTLRDQMIVENVADSTFNSAVGQFLVSESRTPGPEGFRNCDLAILDSEARYRTLEVLQWAKHAPFGSFCLVHDVLKDRAPDTTHRQLYTHIAVNIQNRPGINGIYLPNPRGGWLGQKVS